MTRGFLVLQGYQGVIVGWDRTCCEDELWKTKAKVDRLARREKQPFYHLFVDQVRLHLGQNHVP
jgi:hemimethylated DNA binding protein